MRNITSLLKDRIGIIVFDRARKKKVTLVEVKDDGITCKREDNEEIIHYTPNGTLDGFYDGIQILVPSENVLDWERLTWKRGDVIIFDEDQVCIFENWSSDDYSKFNGKFVNANSCVHLYKDAVRDVSSDGCINATNFNSSKYIKELEEYFGGKFNPETLQFDSNFKDGDIVILCGGNTTAILKSIENCNRVNIYAYMNRGNSCVYYHNTLSGDNLIRSIHLATDSEKQQFLYALEKEGKRWNPKTKQIEDLLKYYQFKPLDYFIAKRKNSEAVCWQLYQFAYINRNDFIFYANDGCIEAKKYDILPYNDRTKHLIGTTNEWKE